MPEPATRPERPSEREVDREWLDSLDRPHGRALRRDGAPTEAVGKSQTAAEDAVPTERPIILIGGGRVGRALLRKFPDALVLETDPSKIEKLREEFGAGRIFHGSGADPEHLRMAGLVKARALVACTHSDEVNFKAALAAKDARVRKVIARLEYADQAPRFRAVGVEPISAPLNVCINMITNLLSPARRTIGEGVVPQSAPTVGAKIADLDLPTGAIIVSILRGDDLISPDANERLAAGDVVTVMTEKADLAKTLTIVTGRDLAINPLDRLYVPIYGKETLKGAFREAFVLAEYADAEIFLMCPDDIIEVAKEAERLCRLAQIDVQTHVFKRDDFDRAIVERIKQEDLHPSHGGLRDHLFFECLVIDPPHASAFRKLIGDTRVDRLTRSLDHPVLVARNLKPYRNILLVIDNSSRSSMTVANTIDLALVYGSDITALLPEAAAGEEALRLLRHLRRAGRIYGVDVIERVVKGNPTIEYIREVKSGKYDLIVVDWLGRSVKRDILRRVVEYGPRSTLVLP